MNNGAGFVALLEQVEAVASDTLWPSAAMVDQATTIPAANYEALARLGLFAMALPTTSGGPGLSPPEFRRIMRVLGGSCGATAFAFAQHHGVVSAVARTSNDALRDRWLPRLRHDTLGGTAFAHVRRTGPAAVRAVPAEGGWRLDGEAPWATSWGTAEVFSVAATASDGRLVWLLVAGTATDGFEASEPLPLMVFGATGTVRLRFDGLFVPETDVLDVIDFLPWQRDDRRGAARPNPLCLGVGDRALSLLVASAPETAETLRTEWEATVEQAERASVAVDERSGDVAAIAAVRTETILAVQRITTALLAASGGRGAELGHPAQQLAREALFYVVQAQNADGRSATLEGLTANTQTLPAGG